MISCLRLSPHQTTRVASRSAGAEMLVVYDVSPARSHRSTSVPGLGVLTLGAFPNEYEKAYANASATFVDTQTGFVYATAEVTSSSTEIQNAWQRSDNTVHLKAQRAALRDLLKECRGTWKTVHARFASAGEKITRSAKSTCGAECSKRKDTSKDGAVGVRLRLLDFSVVRSPGQSLSRMP